MITYLLTQDGNYGNKYIAIVGGNNDLAISVKFAIQEELDAKQVQFNSNKGFEDGLPDWGETSTFEVWVTDQDDDTFLREFHLTKLVHYLD